MLISKKIRNAISWTFPLWFVPLALNVENLTVRLRIDNFLADAVAPTSGVSPLIEAIDQPWASKVSLIVLGLIAGIWIDTWLRAIDAHLSNARWWEGVHSFSIERASCLMAGIKPNDFANSERAKGIADELIGLVRAGQIPTNLEPSIYSEVVLDHADFGPNEPIYKQKPSIGLDAVIAKTQVALFAKRRGIPLPW